MVCSSMGKVQSQPSPRPRVFDASAACVISVERGAPLGKALGSCYGQQKTSKNHRPNGASPLLLWRAWLLDARGAAAGTRARW